MHCQQDIVSYVQVLYMDIGKRILEARKQLNLTQAQFAAPLGVNRGYIATLETSNKEPSETLLKLISYEYCISYTWLKTGEGKNFSYPEEIIKKQIACIGQQAVLDAFLNVLKECSLGITVLQQLNRHGSNDPELSRMIDILHDLWTTGDNKFRSWMEVQFNRAFPADVVEEAAQKKQKETYGQASNG